MSTFLTLFIHSLSPKTCGWNLKCATLAHNLETDRSGIRVNINLKWIPDDLEEGKSTLVQVMAWCSQETRHYRNLRSWWRHQWKHFPRYWPFVCGIHRSPVNSPQKGQWRGTLVFSLICVWINGWVNNREAGDLRRYGAHYDVTVMWPR